MVPLFPLADSLGIMLRVATLGLTIKSGRPSTPCTQGGPLKLFLRGLPQDVTPQELYEFVTRAIIPPWYRPFTPRGVIKSCVVMRMKDLDRNTVEFHGLLEIQPDNAALAALRDLDRLRFKEAPIEVRQWQPRREQGAQHQDSPTSRRQEGLERRRDRLIVDMIETYAPHRFLGH